MIIHVVATNPELDSFIHKWARENNIKPSTGDMSSARHVDMSITIAPGIRDRPIQRALMQANLPPALNLNAVDHMVDAIGHAYLNPDLVHPMPEMYDENAPF